MLNNSAKQTNLSRFKGLLHFWNAQQGWHGRKCKGCGWQKLVGTAGRARCKLQAEWQTRPAGDKHPAMQRMLSAQVIPSFRMAGNELHCIPQSNLLFKIKHFEVSMKTEPIKMYLVNLIPRLQVQLPSSLPALTRRVSALCTEELSESEKNQSQLMQLFTRRLFRQQDGKTAGCQSRLSGSAVSGVAPLPQDISTVEVAQGFQVMSTYVSPHHY